MQAMQVDRLSIRRRPRGLPLMRQWWGKLLFMHWPIAPKLLRPLVPSRLTIDTFEGRAWVGVVPFTMWGVRASFLPPIPGTSAFHELNVRTYVHYDGVPGVWFMSMDANNALGVWGARRFYHLPYFNARMNLRENGRSIVYGSERTDRRSEPAHFGATWEVGEPVEQATPDTLTFFLTERYCLYSARREELFRCRIHHPPWPLRRAALTHHNSTLLESLGLPEPQGEPLLHYAEAIKTDIWPLRRLLTRIPTQVFEPTGAAL
jgi:uncharacterized protein YqjF (DUF2071 family)